MQQAGYPAAFITTSNAEALKWTAQVVPDLVLVGVWRGNESWIEIASVFRKPRQDISVVYLLEQPDRGMLRRMTEAGPQAYLVRPFNPDELRSTVAIVLATANIGRYWRARVTSLEKALERLADVIQDVGITTLHQAPNRPEWANNLRLLILREWEVVRALLRNRRVSGIADTLQISPHTVRSHLKSVFRKLCVTSQSDLIGRLSNLSNT